MKMEAVTAGCVPNYGVFKYLYLDKTKTQLIKKSMKLYCSEGNYKIYDKYIIVEFTISSVIGNGSQFKLKSGLLIFFLIFLIN